MTGSSVKTANSTIKSKSRIISELHESKTNEKKTDVSHSPKSYYPWSCSSSSAPDRWRLSPRCRLYTLASVDSELCRCLLQYMSPSSPSSFQMGRSGTAGSDNVGHSQRRAGRRQKGGDLRSSKI